MGRVCLIILDGFGVGAMPDARDFGDEGSNTFGSILQDHPQIKLPHLQKMGLFNIIGSERQVENPDGAFGKMALASPNKDTTSGHWEICGIILERPFPVFPEGFPSEVMQLFQEKTGYGYLGNKAASGTKIIKELGEEHIKTRKPIVYTSADSVFQIAAHEEVIPVEELYRICEISREILQGDWAVGRVIARPFIGEEGSFTRTSGRKDFSLEPPKDMLLDYLKRSRYNVTTVGKLEQIFAYRGISRSVPTKDNADGLVKLEKELATGDGDLIFINLVDFDMKYGHRNDVEGFAGALEEFDAYLPRLKKQLNPEDMVIITADHGTDPGFPSTDHTREYVPVLIWGADIKKGIDLGVRKTLADVGATIGDFFNLGISLSGTSFWSKIKK